jgi:hypothetical protein
MEQSHQSSERENIAIQQAQETLTLPEDASTEVAQAVSREKYLRDMMAAASLEMTGKFHYSRFFHAYRYLFVLLCHILQIGSFLAPLPKINELMPEPLSLLILPWIITPVFGLPWIGPDKLSDFKIARVRFENISRSVPRF